MTKPKLHEDILELLKQRAITEPDGYINPNFLVIISQAIYDYYNYEDDIVDEWIRDMWGM